MMTKLRAILRASYVRVAYLVSDTQAWVWLPLCW
jgi:hypothetical protein